MCHTYGINRKGHMTTATFQAGNAYVMRWAGDADARTATRVVKRTAKFVTLWVEGFGVKRCAIRTNDQGEFAFPLGSYSMAPCVRACREVA